VAGKKKRVEKISRITLFWIELTSLNPLLKENMIKKTIHYKDGLNHSLIVLD